MAKRKMTQDPEQVVDEPIVEEVAETPGEMVGVVNCTLLNIRKTPSVTAGKVIGTLDNGTLIKIKSINDGWCRLADREGFVKAEFVTLR